MIRQRFNTLLDLLNNEPSIRYSVHTRELLIPNNDKTNAILTDFNGLYEDTAEGYTMRFPTSQLPFYYEIENYLKDFALDKLSSDFGVFCRAGRGAGDQEFEGIFYDHTLQNYYRNGHEVTSANIVSNNVFYLKIIEFLGETSNGFANYSDPVEHKIVAISGTKGTMIIGYPDVNPGFDSSYNLGLILGTLDHNLKAKGYLEIFKSELYDQIKTTSEADRLPELIRSSKNIFENTDRNFEVYMSNFSFDKLKDSLRQEKFKYYNLTRDILSKIYTQITSVPIAISASAIATYKVDHPTTLVLILVIFVIYTGFIWQLSRTIKAEVKSVKTDFESEKLDIKKNSKLDSGMIEKEIEVIQKRISNTLTTIIVFRIAFVLLAIMFIIYIVFQLNNPYSIEQDKFDYWLTLAVNEQDSNLILRTFIS